MVAVAVVAVAVVAAAAGGFGGGGGGNQAFGGGGGGFGGGGGGFGGGGRGGGGGVFNIGPDSVTKRNLTTVCLEHGKDDPKPRIAYELKPIDSFTKNKKVVALLGMLGRGEISQEIAQATSWHLTDGLSWEELANKVKVEHLDGSVEMYFSPQQIAIAMQLNQEVIRRTAGDSHDTDEEDLSPGEKITRELSQSEETDVEAIGS